MAVICRLFKNLATQLQNRRRFKNGTALAFLLQDKRAVTAIAFGVSASVVVGMVGLGTEAGGWYLTRRNAQNAADHAAYAGAVRLSFAQNALVPSAMLDAARTQATAAAADTATRNGFTDGINNTNVSVNTPPAAGFSAGNSTAVEVIVSRTPSRLISALFLATDPVILVRGVAAVTSNGSVCMLAMAGGSLSVLGNATVNALDCSLGSNATGPSAISVGNSVSIGVRSLTSVGGCSNCTQPYTEYALPTSNPFAALDSKVLPVFNVLPLLNPLLACRLPQLSYVFAPSTMPFCSTSGLDLKIGVLPVTFLPGTYYFHNMSLVINGGTVTGQGVTMVFTGVPAQIGAPNIGGNATVNLTAPVLGAASDPDYGGVLFFRDPRATGGSSTQAIINGGANTVLNGGMYFPNSEVKYSGNADIDQCSILVGTSITLTGNSSTNITQCAALGFSNIVPVARVVKLME